MQRACGRWNGLARGRCIACICSARPSEANVITLSPDTLKEVIAEARLAPSVHNLQPSRWRLVGDNVLLLGDSSRAIPVADPVGRDWRVSEGANFEGLSMAVGRRRSQVVRSAQCELGWAT